MTHLALGVGIVCLIAGFYIGVLYERRQYKKKLKASQSTPLVK